MRTAFIALSALALASCGGEEGDGNVVTAPAGSVDAVAAPAGQSWTEVVERTPEGGFRMGNPDAPLKLVEFGSRTCHVCAMFAAASEPLKNQYVASGKVSFEYRDFIRNGADLAASLIGQCAGPAPFFPLVDQMMASQEEVLGRLQALPQSFYEELNGATPAQQTVRFAEAAGYIDFAKQRGIPEAQARQCLADAQAAEQLTNGTQSASEQYSIMGTPTFLLNGEVIPNATSWPQVEAALKAAGA